MRSAKREADASRNSEADTAHESETGTAREWGLARSAKPEADTFEAGSDH
jgi:hypothetical protein